MKRLVAVEVTAEHIYAVEIEAPLTNKPKLVKHGEIALEQGIAGESEVFELEALTDAFKELWKIHKFTAKHVALGISGRRTIVRDFETQEDTFENIKSRLPFEAANMIPQQMGNPIIDFYPAALIEKESGNMVEGSIIATPSEPIEKLVGVIQAAGLEVMYVDFIPFAVARAARKAYEAKGEYLIVNIRSFSSDIIALKNGVPEMVRVIPNGLTVREQSGGKHRGVADAAASFAGGQNPSNPVDALVAGVRSTMNFYINRGGQPAAVLLTGEGSLSPELQEKLPEGLQLRTGLLSMENVTKISRKDDGYGDIERAGAISALGVGMRGLKG